LESVEPLSNLFNNGVELSVFAILGIELGLVLIALLRSPNRCVFPEKKKRQTVRDQWVNGITCMHDAQLMSVAAFL
jgi:hypothetical protein